MSHFSQRRIVKVVPKVGLPNLSISYYTPKPKPIKLRKGPIRARLLIDLNLALEFLSPS